MIDHAKLFTEFCILHELKVRPVWNLLADEVRVGVKDSFADIVDNGGIVDHWPTPNHRCEGVVQIAVCAEIVGDAAADSIGIIRVHPRAAEVGSCIGSQVGKVGRELGCRLMRCGHLLPQ